MAKVDKCKTERDYARTLSIYVPIFLMPILILFVISILTTDMNYKSEIWDVIHKLFVLGLVLIPFGVMEIVYILMWYPYDKRRKSAMKYGETYDGKIISINYKTKSKWLVLMKSTYFTLTVSYDNGKGQKQVESDLYVGGHWDYIPLHKKCKVYELNGKAYLQDFTYIENNEFPDYVADLIKQCEEEGKYREANIWRQTHALNDKKKYFKTYAEKYGDNCQNRVYTSEEELVKYNNQSIRDLNKEEFEQAIAERECIPPKYSNSHILTPALIITGEEKNAYVFVELKIISYIAYSYDEMGYYVDLCKYLKTNKDLYFSGREEEFISGIKQVVERKTQLLSTEKNYFKLKEVLVSIRDMEKRKSEKEVELW